jgi:hypothetical protein
MVRAAKTLAIGDIEGGATILALDDVVSEESCRRRYMAALAVVDRLAPVSGTLQDLLAPSPMLWCEQFRVGLLRYRLSGAQVYLPVLLADLADHVSP